MKVLLVLSVSLLLFGQTDEGTAVYDKYCSQCHGDQGAGDGPAADFVDPKPRDFTTGVFKFRSTQSGQLPQEEDLIRVVRDGIPGTSMPAFGHIGDAKVNAVVKHIQPFYQATIDRDKEEGFYPPQVAETGNPPKINDAKIAHGREVYLESGCGDCHGYQGRADGPSALTLVDDYDAAILPANLHRGWEFRSGHSLEDIFKAFTTGISGTPMASFADAISVDDRWDLAAYVASLSSAEEYPTSPQVTGALVDELPQTMDDEIWDTAQKAYFPLTGQMMWDPVNTHPMIRSVSVRAVHDGTKLVLLCEWDDPSYSFEGASAPEAASDDDDWGFEEEGSEEEGDFDDFFSDEEESSNVSVLPDQFAIQFPTGIPADNERPYFVMGDDKNAVNLWRWSHDGSLTAVEAAADGQTGHQNLWTEFVGPVSISNQIAKGRDKVSENSEALEIKGQLHYRNGQYRLMLTRDLQGGSDNDIQLEPGRFVPMLFWAWDGHRQDSDAKACISSWYFLNLEQPVDKKVYVKTAAAVALTLLFLWWATRTAKRRALEAPEQSNPQSEELAV